IYSYEEFLRVVAHEAGLERILVPIPFAAWHALAWIAEVLPTPPITRNQVELMEIDTVCSAGMPGFEELAISPSAVEDILKQMLSSRSSSVPAAFQGRKSAPRFRHGYAAANRAICARAAAPAASAHHHWGSMPPPATATAVASEARLSIGFINWAHALDHYVMLIFPTVVIGLEIVYGRSYAELIALGMPAFIAFGVFSLPAGWLGDRWSRRNMMAVFYAGCGLSLVAAALAPNLIVLA